LAIPRSYVTPFAPVARTCASGRESVAREGAGICTRPNARHAYTTGVSASMT
jgi:hypothetical protein